MKYIFIRGSFYGIHNDQLTMYRIYVYKIRLTVGYEALDGDRYIGVNY
jgi:hypothetical protein